MCRVFTKCLLLLCCVAVSSQLTITEFVVPPVAEVGDQVELKCSYKLADGKSDEGYIVKWWRTPIPQEAGKNWTVRDSEHRTNIYQRIIGAKPSAHHDIQIKEHDTILLLNVTPADSGVYECQVSNDVEKEQDAIEQNELIVFAKGTGPELNFTTVADGPDADDEEDVSIDCVAKDVAPQPDLIIKLDGKDVIIDVLIDGPDTRGLFDVYGNVTVSKGDAEGQVTCELVYLNPGVPHPPYIDTEDYNPSGAVGSTEAPKVGTEREAASELQPSTDHGSQAQASWIMVFTIGAVARFTALV